MGKWIGIALAALVALLVLWWFLSGDDEPEAMEEPAAVETDPAATAPAESEALDDPAVLARGDVAVVPSSVCTRGLDASRLREHVHRFDDDEELTAAPVLGERRTRDDDERFG